MAFYSAALLCITEAENQVFAALGTLSTMLLKQKPPPSVIIQALNTIPCWQTVPRHLLDSSTSLSKCKDQHRPQHRWKLKSFLWYLYLFPDLALPSVINSYFMSHCSAGPVHCPHGLCFISFQIGLLAWAGSCSVVFNASFRCKHHLPWPRCAWQEQSHAAFNSSVWHVRSCRAPSSRCFCFCSDWKAEALLQKQVLLPLT